MCSGSPYTITASGAVDSDYTISYVAGTLTVTLRRSDDHGRQPDQGLRRASADADGQLFRFRQRRHLGQPRPPSPPSPPPPPPAAIPGAYAITASGAVDPDYTISYVAGTLTVSPATLTVTANDQTRPQGEANPPLTYTFSGFVNGDTAGVVSGMPILSTTATIASPDGQYPIAIAVGTLTAANYDFITVGGTLTVANTPATAITLTASPGSTSTYGQALTFTATVNPFHKRQPDADRHCGVRDRRHSHRLGRGVGQRFGHERRDQQAGRRRAHDRGHLLR